VGVLHSGILILQYELPYIIETIYTITINTNISQYKNFVSLSSVSTLKTATPIKSASIKIVFKIALLLLKSILAMIYFLFYIHNNIFN